MSERDVVPFVLAEEEHRDRLERLIVPAATADAVEQDQPVVVFVVGQPGAGKTLLADLVQAALDRRGGAVRVGRDLYKKAHPRYAGLLAEDVRTAGVKVRPDTRRWQDEVEERVRAGRWDAVVETALADIQEFRATAGAYRKARHRIEVIALATQEALSQLGLVDRLLRGGPYVSWENHDSCARALPGNLAAVEAEGLADRVMLVNREMRVLYDNELVGGEWCHRPAAGQTVTDTWARWWSAQETAVFRRELAATDRRVHRELDEDRRLAVQRDIERAAALAEPVRRVAQPTLVPPGVDYHRLSPEEHQWIFEELVVPDLGVITPQEQPIAVYVLAQPGAGKTQHGRRVWRSLRNRRPTWITGDTFKQAHPDYLRLLKQDPRMAGARIRADYKDWQRQAEAHVREQRGDVVIEMAPGDPDDFIAGAERFHRAGYPVHLVVIAARAADSRQGTAARHARGLRTGPTRFTKAAGHDRCFTAVAPTVRAAEEGRAVASVTVVRRDGSALFRNERHDGLWDQAPGATGVLVAEQHRPYTPQEAAGFLTIQRQLRIELPQHRDELLDITRLAWPLFPYAMRPRRLTRPPAPTLLPVPVGPGGYCSSSSLMRAA